MFHLLITLTLAIRILVPPAPGTTGSGYIIFDDDERHDGIYSEIRCKENNAYLVNPSKEEVKYLEESLKKREFRMPHNDQNEGIGLFSDGYWISNKAKLANRNYDCVAYPNEYGCKGCSAYHPGGVFSKLPCDEWKGSICKLKNGTKKITKVKHEGAIKTDKTPTVINVPERPQSKGVKFTIYRGEKSAGWVFHNNIRWLCNYRPAIFRNDASKYHVAKHIPNGEECYIGGTYVNGEYDEERCQLLGSDGVIRIPSLPYDYSALEPYIDSTTMNIHHTKHHQAYVTKLNDALGASFKGDLVEIQKNVKNSSVGIRNNGGGHYNHSLFWNVMAKVGETNVAPHGELKSKIDQSFGSFDEMKKKFNDAAATRFGSGWAWLGVKTDGSIGICSTANQDNPLMKGIAEVEMIPILGLDVWEHAYYLKYQNRRPEYIAQWWNVVNWDKVVEYYDTYAKDGKAVPF